MAVPKVTVIMPNYNYARYLPERIESVLSQSYQDYEIILLDDCSTDNSREIIERYRSNPKVTEVIYNDSNSGTPFRQWFKGIELARGEYIWIAETDDSAKPDFLAKMVAALDANPKAAIAISGTECIDENGNTTDATFDRWDGTSEQGDGVVKVYNGRDYLRHNMYWACYVYNASCVIFRKRAFYEDDYSRSLSMRNAGDWLFWSRMLCHGDIVEVREKLSYLRRHSQSVTYQGTMSNNLLKEDAKVVKAIEDMTDVGWYRRAIRHGEMIKRVKRMDLPEEVKSKYLHDVMATLDAKPFEYLIERINKPLSQYLPFLITSRKDLI